MVLTENNKGVPGPAPRRLPSTYFVILYSCVVAPKSSTCSADTQTTVLFRRCGVFYQLYHWPSVHHGGWKLLVWYLQWLRSYPLTATHSIGWNDRCLLYLWAKTVGTSSFLPNPVALQCHNYASSARGKKELGGWWVCTSSSGPTVYFPQIHFLCRIIF